MIVKPVVVTYDYIVDEQTGFAVCNGQFVKFDESVDAEGNKIVADSFTAVDACAIADFYLEQGLKIPVEFGAARDCISAKISALQAVL